MRLALRRRLPEIEPLPERSDTLTVIANGPGALQAPLDGRPTIALNGALKLFHGKCPPTYWAAFDAQPMVAEFVRDAPLGTTYLVGSKCCPAVFDNLAGRDVRLWHILSAPTQAMLKERWLVVPGVSITLTAFSLMRMLGYRKFDVWGWDGCFVDGKDHAVPQRHTKQDWDIEVGGRTFRSTTTWAAEGEEAVLRLRQGDYSVTVNGDGYFGALLRFLKVPAAA